MNKTLKTIAWICLVLGILGTALDVGTFVFARKSLNDRQAAYEERQSTIDENELPRFRDCIIEDEDGNIVIDPVCLDDRRSNFLPPGRNFPMQSDRGSLFPRQRSVGLMPLRGRLTLLPLLFFVAAGPVLTIIGAVILIVNREPVQKEPKEGKKKTKKN